MKAERHIAIACAIGTALCIAGAAHADTPAMVATSAASITVIVTPEPTRRERLAARGITYATADEVREGAAFCSGWFVAPMAFGYATFPAARAVNDQRAWRALPADKQAHAWTSATLGGIGAALAFSLPVNADASPWLWKRGAAIGAVCLGAGLAKEAADEDGYRLGRRDHGAEAGDLAADAAGCAAGIATGAAIGTATRVSLGLVVGANGGTVAVQGRF